MKKYKIKFSYKFVFLIYIKNEAVIKNLRNYCQILTIITSWNKNFKKKNVMVIITTIISNSLCKNNKNYIAEWLGKNEGISRLDFICQP